MNLPDSKTKIYTKAYTDYYPLISGIVYSKIRDLHTTHDICQEIFTRFYTKFEEVENHRKWLLGTINYVLLEHYRKTSGDHVDIDSVMDDVKMSFVNGFRDTRMMIEDALDNMEHFGDEKNRVLFDLVAAQNYTYKEAGMSLGLSERQVRYRYTVIVDKLMKHFRSKGIHGLEDLL